MAQQSTDTPCCKDSSKNASRCNALPTAASVPSQQITLNLLARLAAVALVTASAGFGALYAWTYGIQHGTAFAALAVLMALGLECAKPLAIVTALRAFGSWRVGTGLAMLVLGTVAIAYSLTAELSLMAGARGDLIAERAAANTVAKNTATQRSRIEAELVSLGTGRSAAAIEIELAPVLTDKRLANCDEWLESVRLRTLCIEKVAPLRSELASAERRETLQRNLAHLNEAGPSVEVKPDPAAAALTVYFAQLGMMVEPATFSEWIVLVPVLALEIGSAFAGLLVGALTLNAGGTLRSTSTAPDRPEVTAIAPPASVSTGVSLEPDRLPRLDGHAERLLSMLQGRGGQVFGGQRAFASALNISPASVNRLFRELTEAGRIAVEAGKSGTRVKLVPMPAAAVVA